MSKTVDERVVSMQFDNRQFESNVRTTMSTLERLKQSLNLKGASKGFEDISAAAKNVNLTPLADSTNVVVERFSLMGSAVNRVIENMVDQAFNAGKRIVSALTIDPITTGLSEYETKINAIQVIKANTRSKYSSEIEQMNAINSALSDLNDYADRTIYNFAQMTDNVGKFVAQGLTVEDAANAVQGMANLAGASGASAQDMARATYQMSQALGGVIRKIDWNSLRNANMASVELKNTLIDIAKARGINIDGMIAEKGVFEDTLEEGWLTGEMFTEAMNIYSDVYSEAELKAKGFTDAQIANFKGLAKSAREATTEVKTVTQLWDVLKETAQSGWTQTWELLFGDFDAAKRVFTDLQNYFSNILNNWSEVRNTILGGVFRMKVPWESITSKLSKAGIGKVAELAEKVADVTKKLEDFQDIVSRVWSGEFGNSDTGRYDKLEELGWDYRVVQDLVNKGVDYKLTVDDIEESHKKFGLTLKKNEEAVENLVDPLSGLSDAQLRNAGLTETEIQLFRDLEKEAERTGTTISDVAKKMSEYDGRAMVIDTLKNAWSGLESIFKSLRAAWVDIFPPVSIVRLYSIVEAIKEFSENLVMAPHTAGKLTRTFKGLFAALDILGTVLAGPIKIGFKILQQFLAAFDLDILSVTAKLGDGLVKLRDWIDASLDFSGIFERIAPSIKKVIDRIKEFISSFKNGSTPINRLITDIRAWIDSLKDAEDLPKAIADGIVNGLGKAINFVKGLFSDLRTTLSTGFDGIGDTAIGQFAQSVWNGLGIVGQVFVELGKKALEKLNEALVAHGFKEIPDNLISGFAQGIRDKASNAWSAIIEFGNMIITKFKDLLGIHSPSTVFMALGGFIIAGLVLGITKNIPVVGDAMTNLGNKCLEIIRNIDFGKAFSTIVTGAMTVSVFKIAKAFENFSAPFAGVADVLDNVSDVVEQFGETLKTLGKAVSFNIKMQAFKALAIAIAIIVASVIALALVGPEKLLPAIGILTLIAGIMAALTVVINKFGGTDPKDITKVGLTLLGIAGAILVLAIAAKMMSKMSGKELAVAITMLAVIAGIMVGLMAATKLLAKNTWGNLATDIYKVGTMLLGIAAAMLILTIAAKKIAKMEWSELGKAGAGIAVLAGIMVGLIAATKLLARTADGGISADVYKTGTMLLGIAAAMLILTIAAKMIAKMEWSDMGKAAVGLAGLGLIVLGLVATTKLAGNNIDKIGSTILAIAAAMLLLTFTAKVIAGMSWPDMAKAAAGLAGLGAIITGLIWATKLASGGDKLSKVGTTLILVAVAIAILAGVAVVLGLIDPASLANGLAAVGYLSVMMMGLIAVTKYAQNCTKTIVAIAIVIAVVAGAVAALSFIDPTSLFNATAAVSLLIGMLSLLLAASRNATGSIGTLIVITAAIAVLAGAVYLLATMTDTDKALKSALALSALVIAMSAAMFVVGKSAGKFSDAVGGIVLLASMTVVIYALVGALALMQNVENAMSNAIVLGGLMIAMTVVVAALALVGNKLTNALTGVVALTLMAVPLYLIVGALALMSGVNNALANARALAELMVAMTVLLIPLTLVGLLMTTGYPVVGIVALTAMIVPMFAFIWVLSTMEKIPNAQANAELLINLMVIMTDVLTKLAIIGPLAIIGVAALAGLSLLIVGIGLLAVGIADLMNVFPDLEQFIDVGLGVLEKLAYGLGSVISAFASGITSGLPEVGDNLSAFMDNATPFINGIKMVDPSMTEGVKALTTSILLLTAADLISGIASFIQGGSSFASLGAELYAFAMCALPFFMIAKMIDPSAIEGVKSIADMILTLTKADILDGLTSWFTGGSSLTTFGAELAAFGPSLRTFADSVAGIDGESVKAAAIAGKTLAEMCATIPNEGGVVGWFAGENSLAAFSDQLPGFATNLKAFADNVAGLDASGIDSAVTAAQKLADMTATIPNEGGVAGWFMGENSISAFADQLPEFGTNLKAFATNVAGLDATSIDAAVAAAQKIVDLTNAVPNEGGVVGWFTGENSLASFASQLPEFGTNLADFAANVTGLSTTTVDSAITACERVVAFAKTLPDNKLFVNETTISDFGSQLKKFGEKVADFCDELDGVSTDTMADVATQIEKLGEVAASTTNIESLGTALKTLASEGITSFVDTFKESEDKVVTVGKDLIENLVDGIEAAKLKPITTMREVLTNTADAVKKYYNKFKSAGKYLVDGFAEGISARSYKAEAKAAAMAKAALQAAKDELDVNSPSKVFKKLGESVPEGFAMGIDTMGSAINDSVVSMASTALNGTKNMIARLAEYVDTDIDTQPTIRPVLDLSDVTSGANRINGLFNMTPSVGVLSNVGSVSAMMNTNSQNGANDDVISAIKELGSALSNVGGDTYNINGITYDDDSSVADAIRTLTRAAKMERRV